MLYTYTRQSYASVYNGKPEESIFHHIYAITANDLCLTIFNWILREAQG